ncbi:MAG: ferrochelatase [Bacteroidales bacterium]|nr:ferrochelatase [Bacteroidales bacterium]
MQQKSETRKRHSNIALLIANYGTPKSAKVGDVRRYLRQLLDNRHVMTMNPFGRKILVNCIIAPLRAPKSAALYAQLPLDNGEMPLLAITRRFADKVQRKLSTRADVFVGMTAGTNLIKDTLAEILALGYSQLMVVPMFPHYAESTTVNIIDEVYSFFRGKASFPCISVLPPFYSSPYYIDSLSALIQRSLGDVVYDKYLFSYHGVPDAHCLYVTQCHETTKLLCESLNIPEHKAVTSFQSRMHDNWSSPFSDEVVKNLASEGVKKLAVVAPSFTVDCLETVVEINKNLRQLFMSNGGGEFCYVPCLNDDDSWVDGFFKILCKSEF